MNKKFIGIQRIFEFTQTNHGAINDVFSLLCPVREKDWIDGWEYTMIHSNSGVAEKNCVFTTPNHEKFDTVWHITQHDSENHIVEFLRVTPSENTVRINIQLEKIDDSITKTNIRYRYTGLTEEQNDVILNKMNKSFIQSMNWWEKAINHYLKTGEKLMK